MSGFSGSYAAADVTFLLDTIEVAPTPVEEKERLLQSGQRHYSEMIGVETAPDPEYLALYATALRDNADRLARDVARLAWMLRAERPDGVVLVSLARAGTPIGVLLKRALERLGGDAVHYSVSIIRDRGIDTCALDHILSLHPPARWVFVDGWTGKGAIAGELRGSIAAYAESRGIALDPTLAVVSDLAGVARFSATDADYLIPSSILNAVVSGLVSRTILPRDHAGGFHRCVYYAALAPHDLSRAFVDALRPRIDAALEAGPAPGLPRSGSARATSEAFLARSLVRWGIHDVNRIKPGIGEATRALLRRVPERLLLQTPGADDIRHLELLAERKGVLVEGDAALPYRAAVLIRSLGFGS